MTELFTQLMQFKMGLNTIALILSVITSIVLLYKYWNDIFFWRMNYFYRWPLIGRMSSHKKNLHLDAKTGWFDGEKQLCADFYPMYWKYAQKSEGFYEDCKDYLAKASETGRTPIPKLRSIVLWLFVFGEAVIFSQLILAFAGELSNNQITWIAPVIALLIAIVLLFLTEKTGHELYKNFQINKIRVWHASDKEASHNIPRPNLHVRLDKNHLDASDADYQQILNRLDDVNAEVTPTYWNTIGTGILIAIIAIVAFTERASLNVDIIADTPAGAYATYLFYSIVFLSIQAMGIALGYTYGFASKEGKKAWEETHKFLTSDDYLMPYKIKADHYAFLGQNRLSELQKYIRSVIKNEDSEKVDKTFLAYAINRSQG